MMAASTTVFHCYYGFNEVLTDYLHPRKRGILGHAIKAGWNGLTIVVAGGLFYLAVFDKGITRTGKEILTA